MYLYPTFLEDKCDQKIINIICDHMNEAAISAISYLIDMYESLKGPNPSEKDKKEARNYLNLFFPEQLKGKRKLSILNYILDRLKSPVLGDLRDEYVYILYQALINFYNGNQIYSLEKKEDEDLNIFRIKNDEDRNLVINSLKENINDLKSFYSEENEENLLEYLMGCIENINMYEGILVDLSEDEDFLDFIPIAD